MPRRVSSATQEEIQQSVYGSSQGVTYVNTRELYIAHLVGGALTTGGTQYSAAITASTGVTSKSTAHKTVLSSTISWPGLDGEYIDEMELYLDAGFKDTTDAGTTVGYRWEMKDQGESTWTALSTFIAFKTASTANYTTRRAEGYRLTRDGSLAAGYNKLPTNLRLRFYNKTAAKVMGRVKNTSYVAIKPKRS